MMSENVQAIVVVAGMEGALSSMLQSCALGLTVVNIDNGIGAGSFAALIANRMSIMEKIK